MEITTPTESSVGCESPEETFYSTSKKKVHIDQKVSIPCLPLRIYTSTTLETKTSPCV